MILRRNTTDVLGWLLARDFGVLRLIKLDSFLLFDLGVSAIVVFVKQHLSGS